MEDEEISRLGHEASEEPKGSRREDESNDRPGRVKAKIRGVGKRMRSLRRQGRQRMDTWGLEVGDDARPHVLDVHARKALAWTLLVLAAILFEFLTSGASALLWVAETRSPSPRHSRSG
jgi:hypothetical protein